MVTVKNYTEEIKNVDLSKLPKELLQEEKSIKNKFKFYGRSDVITDTIDTYLELINTAYKVKSKPKAKSEKKVVDKTPSSNVLRSQTIDGTKIELVSKGSKVDFLVDGRGRGIGSLAEMETQYNEQLKVLEYNIEPKKPKPKKVIAKKIDKNDVDSYSNLFRLLRRFKNFISKEKVTFSQARLLFMAFSKSAIQRKIRLNNLNSKLFEKANDDVVKIFKAAEDNIEDAKEYGLNINLSNPKKYDDIMAFVNSKQINISIRLLNRFISMQGTLPEKTKVSRLIKAIENSIKKDKLKKDNRLYDSVIDAKKELNDYLNDMSTPVDVKSQGLSGSSCSNRIKCEGLTKNGQLKKGYKFKPGGDVIKVKKKSKGLKSPPFEVIELDTEDIKATTPNLPIVPVKSFHEYPKITVNKSIPKKLNRSNKVISASDNINPENFNFFNVPGAVGDFLQRVEKKEKDSVVITIDGKQGAGKTTMLYQFMDAFASGGNMSLFASLEQHPKSVLTQDLKDRYLSKSNRSNIDLVGDFEDQKEFYSIIDHYDVIFIDSWQKLIEQIGKINLDKDLRKRFDGKVFVVIFQQTTEGKTKGGASIVFDGDIIVKMETGDTFNENYAYFDKNRYSQVAIDKLRYNIADQRVFDPTRPEGEPYQSSQNEFEYIEI